MCWKDDTWFVERNGNVNMNLGVEVGRHNDQRWSELGGPSCDLSGSDCLSDVSTLTSPHILN